MFLNCFNDLKTTCHTLLSSTALAPEKCPNGLSTLPLCFSEDAILSALVFHDSDSLWDWRSNSEDGSSGMQRARFHSSGQLRVWSSGWAEPGGGNSVLRQYACSARLGIAKRDPEFPHVPCDSSSSPKYWPSVCNGWFFFFNRLKMFSIIKEELHVFILVF